MKAQTKIKLTQLGFTSLEIEALEQLPDLIKEVNALKAKVKELAPQEEAE